MSGLLKSLTSTENKILSLGESATTTVINQYNKLPEKVKFGISGIVFSCLSLASLSALSTEFENEENSFYDNTKAATICLTGSALFAGGAYVQFKKIITG